MRGLTAVDGSGGLDLLEKARYHRSLSHPLNEDTDESPSVQCLLRQCMIEVSPTRHGAASDGRVAEVSWTKRIP
jgi:hypothetical protein